MKTNLLSNLSNGLKKGTGLTQVGYRQGTGKVQAGEKQACGRKESLAWSQVEPISDEEAIEHPLSTHSAPFGIRWKPAGEKGSSRVWKHVAMIFAVLVMSMANIGMAWGATHTVTPNIGGTQYEIYNIYSNSSAYAFFSNATTIRSAYSSWVSGQLSSKSDGGATAPSGWLSTGSGKPGYGKGFVNNSKTVTMTVTNCIEVAFVSKSGGSRTSNLSVKLNGVEVGSVATNGNSYAAVTYGTALDASKTYTITLSGSNSSNCEVDQIRFKAPAVCSAALGGTTSNPSATVGESAGTISCTVNNGAAKTATSYQWYKNTSKSTSGATSISGATSSTYSPNEASAGTYYYYCTVQTAQITTDGADAARITSDISDAFVFTAAPEPECGSTSQAALTLSSNSGTICGTGSTTFTVSGGSGSGALSVSSSDETKATASIDGSTVTVTGVAAGSATITVTKACDATYAEKTATYSATVAAIPTANAGVDKTTEPGNGVALAATAAASGCTGAWTIQSGPNTSTAQLSSTSSATATFTPTVAGTYTLRWTVTNTSSSCSAYDEMTVSAAVCSISECGNATLTYPIYTAGNLTTSNLFSGATSSNATAVSVGSSPAFTGVTVSAATKGSSANAGACYAKSTPLTGKMQYSASSKSSSYCIDFPFTVNTGYTFTPCDVQVVIQPVSSNQTFTVEITNGTNVYGTSTATLNAGVMEPIIGLTSTAEMSAGNYAVRLYPHGGSSKEFRMGANVILKGTTAAVASDAYGIYIGKNNDNYTLENLTNTSGTTWSKTITLDAGSYYEFKVKKTPSAGDAVWYGNNGKITATTSPAWDFNTSDGNCKLYTTVAGSYTFSWDASTNKLTITYPAGDHPTKRIYMACGSGTWCDATPKFFVHSWGVTEYNTQVQQNACGEYYADIIWYNDYFQFTRNNSTATAYDDQNWNYSQDLTYNSSQLLWTFSSWSGSTGNFSSSAYTPTTYTISYAAGSTTATGGAAISGSKASESKTCGVDFTLPSSAVFTATGYTQVGWAISDGGSQAYALGGTYTTNAAQTFYPVWEVAASLTALECNTLYKVEHMVPASITLSGTGQYAAGLSANTKFEVIGDPAEAGNAGGTPEMKNEAAEFASQSFTARMYLKGASNTTGSGTTFVPTSRAVKFIVSESGTLDIYAHRVDRLYLKKAGDSGTTQLGTSTSGSGSMVSHNVTAGTYYIYSVNNGTCIYGVRLNCCTTPAAPTAFSAGSITSTGATFSITDAGDAASYDIYYATSSTAPTASTPATTTSTSKTKAVTGLTASTTYYAWVRSVCDADHKSAWVALGTTSFTTAAAEPAGDCDELAVITATSSSALTATVGSVTYGSMTGGDGISIDGYSYSVKFNSSGHVDISPKAGETFAAGDSLIVVIYNHGSSAQTIGFKIGSNDYTASTAAHALHYFRQTLVAANISDGKVIINRSATNGSSGYIVAATIKRCGLLPSCTTPVLPTLSNQTVCPGSDIAAWDATQTASLETGETATYSWKKKGSETVLGTSATLDLGSSATESQSGTYVVTVTVSADGKASKSASKEVTLTVTPATETPNISASKTKVYAEDEVTLTATCGSTGVTWNWYKCSNADGTGAGSSLATTAAYTISSAPAVGTHYYKAVATGDGTHSCGTAEYVYTLTVSAANACDTEFWFAKEADRPTGAAAATHITGCPSGSSSASYTASIDGTNYTITGCTGQKTGNVTITVPADNTGTLYVVVQGSSSRTITLSKGGTQIDQQTPTNSVWGVYTVSDLDAGTYTLVSSGNISWGIIALKLCPTISCSDATPTATATNTTVCAGGTITITATGYEDGATFQWQKQNASTNAWENITDSTRATLCYASATSDHAGNYQVVATKTCARTSNTVTIAVPGAPVFGAITSPRTVMETQALAINDVEASDATGYKWYKSANNTLDASDPEIGDSKNLIKAYDGEAIASPAYYVFCIATNSCGADTTSAIAINVTAYVEQDCATRGNEGEAEFEFDYGSAGQGSYSSTACWTMNSNSKFLTYTAPEGKYFKTAKVTIASSSESRASYNWSTDGGSTYTAVALTVNSTLTERTINLSAHGNVDKFQIGRNFNSTGSSNGTLYVSKICFEYIDACTATRIDVSDATRSYNMSGDFTEPTFTLKNNSTGDILAGTLTYHSSNEDIAEVDDEGDLSFNGKAGVVTITASFAGGEISSTNYCSSGQSYTLTVTCGSETAPVITTSGSSVTCSSTITLFARQAAPSTDFADGTYQWYRNGVAISGATAKTYTATTGGVYTVERTKDGCTTVSSNKATITNETLEPEVTRLVPFQYYHKDKTYTEQMKLRHLFAVKDSREYGSTERNFKMELSKNGDPATDVTSSNAFVVKQSDDHTIDTILIDLNKLATKYAENDELEFTCYAVECGGTASALIKSSITMHVIGSTPTLALICSGADGDGTRTTKKLVVGGDFLTGYNKADLCVQTGNTTFDASQEWGLYTKLKNHYIVTPVNGYAEFNKLNYEPFDVLLLTDYPKSSRSEAAQVVIDDMAALCDYRPLLSFKTHFQSEKWKKPNEDGDSVYVYTKWTKKGFTTPPVVTKSHGKLNLNIVCYAHPMFDAIKHGEHVYRDNSDQSQLVYTMLTDEGHEGKKGMQGFEIDAAENFVTIGLTHFNATIATNNPSTGLATWTPGDKDRMLVTVAERQANLEARMILFSLNCGAQSMLTAKGDTVVMKCLEYLISDAANPLTPKADCSFTFDNGAGAPHNADWYKDEENCPGCSGELGDGLWTTEANWGPDRINEPGEFTSVRIAASVEVDDTHAHVLDVRVVDGGSIIIPAGKALEVKGTIRHLDGSEISPTGNDEISIGSSSTGNGTLIFNNNTGDTKARVAMYTTAKADAGLSAAASTWQYIGTPYTDVANARSNYYGSWLYQYGSSGWEVIPNGGPLEAFRGYCITHPDAPVVFDMHGTLAATTLQDISIPAGYTVIANSWVAPIDITTLTDDDMEGISDKTIYFFNTGTDAEGTAGTGTAPGTYVSVPKNSASYIGTWQIPSMQGFYLSSTSAGTLHLDYDRHVRPSTDRSIVSNPMYAPRRAKAVDTDEPAVLKIYARGSRYHDKLVVLEREDFTRGYDSGWDGEAWGGGTLSPMVYVTGEGREDAVSAIPEFEGTVIAFKAGEDNDYHFDFIYDGEESLYLFDTENNTYTQIMTGESYYFSTDDKAPHSRFILTRRGPQIATGIEPTSDSSLKGRAKKLLIENKMYILLNGALYDATGKMVK